MRGIVCRRRPSKSTGTATSSTPNGPVTITPQRTNNILERFFRDQRHAHRRKTGNDSMGRALRAMLADTP
ncbi:MAG: hypothetical protein MUC41_18855 [Syntrophobacteraceae bacterium]|nr:hypothetical protein [Syntrophobacteraceae bacterium]